MTKFAASVALVALLGVAGASTPSRAETGQVAVIFTKGGLIVGVGGGEGVLVLRGHKYPFTVSGMSVVVSRSAPRPPSSSGAHSI